MKRRQRVVPDYVTHEILISNKETALLQYAVLMVASMTLFFVSIFYVAIALGILSINNTLAEWLGWESGGAGALCVIIPAIGLLFGLLGSIAGIAGITRSYASLRKLKNMDVKAIELEEMRYALRRELMIGNINQEEHDRRLKELESRYK